MGVGDEKYKDEYCDIRIILREAVIPATVLAETPSRRAIGRTPSPSALAKITLARRAKPCASVGARNHDSSIARSASVTFNLAAILASLAFHVRYCYFRDTTLAPNLHGTMSEFRDSLRRPVAAVL